MHTDDKDVSVNHPKGSAENKKVSSEEAQGNKATEGIPDIAEKQKNNYKLALIVTALIGLALCGYYQSHHGSSQKQEDKEKFQVEAAPALNISETDSAQSAGKNKQTTISSEAASQADAQKALLARLQAPILTVDNTTQNTTASPSKEEKSLDPNTQFLNQVANSDVETREAVLLKHRSTLITQGNLIHAVLETAINSDLPGSLRAIVSEPVYAEDGTQVLITSGSRLIGQYKSGMLNGQSRVFAVWTRVIEPNGISVQLGSPGIDNLGEAGFSADSVDRHFWQMFGTATLLSILGAGASNIGVNSSDPYNASQAYRQAIAGSLAQTAQNTLQQTTMIPPTIHINQGAPIMVFVANDLRFDQAVPTAQQKVKVF